MKNKVIIKKPSVIEVKKYLKKWNSLEDYFQQERALNKLFLEIYSKNNQIEDVLIKVCALNQFYSTNIRRIFDIANHITNLKIDKDLEENNFDIVEKIAKGHEIRVKKSNKELYLYSFATKYCSHHKPENFPIYDFYVEKILKYFRDSDNFDSFSDGDLKNYPLFRETILHFIKFYNLKMFNIKQIDQYLWILGKEHFLKKYKRY